MIIWRFLGSDEQSKAAPVKRCNKLPTRRRGPRGDYDFRSPCFGFGPRHFSRAAEPIELGASENPVVFGTHIRDYEALKRGLRPAFQLFVQTVDFLGSDALIGKAGVMG